MSVLKKKEWVIEYAGLSLGTHTFELKIDSSFFEDLDYSEIKEGEICVKLVLLKRADMMRLEFNIDGHVKINCDRCADEFNFPLHEQHTLILQVGGENNSRENDDIITVGANEHKIDLQNYLYEYISLSLPLKREHLNESDCNQEVINALQQYKVEKLEEHEVDPRWAGLKNIKLN
jgi:uncharacterized protein